MLKNVIAPIQAWLLSRGQCVGCGMPLDKGDKSTVKGNTEKITCRCGRIYILDQSTSKYRRALFSEV